MGIFETPSFKISQGEIGTVPELDPSVGSHCASSPTLRGFRNFHRPIFFFISGASELIFLAAVFSKFLYISKAEATDAVSECGELFEVKNLGTVCPP